MKPISLPLELLDQCFPFYVVIDDKCRIVSFGNKLLKILPEIEINMPFFHYFAIESPQIESNFAAISKNANSLCKTPLKDRPDIVLKGGILVDPRLDLVFLLLTPWINDINQLSKMGLSIGDFAAYDPVVEYWLMLQSKASLDDARQLAAQLEVQRNDAAQSNKALQQANRKLKQEIAINQQIKTALLESEKRLNSIFISAKDIIALLDNEFQIIFINPALTSVLGYAIDTVLMKPVAMLFEQDSSIRLNEKLQAQQEGKAGCSYQLTAVNQDGRLIPVEVYLAHWKYDAFYTCIIQDISAIVDAKKVLIRSNEELEALVQQRSRELIETSQKLTYLATHDELTGLANRVFYIQQVQEKIAQASRKNEHVAIVFVDLDRFKIINDSLGHHVGNELLTEVSARLEKVLRTGDLACRLSGDDFALLLSNICHANDSLLVIRRLLEAMQVPVPVAGREISLSCSCGLSLYPQDGMDVETLLSTAEVAMFRAKDQYGCSFQYYEVGMQQAIDHKLILEGELRAAIERDEFFLVYQAKMDTFSGAVVGVEALVRWQHPERGVIAPGYFIEFAEQSGLIVAIGEQVLEKACQQLQQWMQQGMKSLQMAINLSALQFTSAGIEEKIAQLLLRYQLPPGAIELEVTESMSMTDPEKTIEMMRKFSAIGLGIAIDDFGTGYSNLSYLQKFPVDSLKIDMAFIKDMVTNSRSLSIVKTIINIGRGMDLKIIAEGVETMEQFSLLRKLECDIVQGYLISRPLTAKAFEEFYRTFDVDALLHRSGSNLSAILLLDDDCNILNAIRYSLGNLGRLVITAEDSEAAYKALATESIGVILCDQYLKHENGTDFLARVAQMYPKVSRILMTGATDFATAEQAINCGHVHHLLRKPCKHNELIFQVKEAIKRHEAVIEKRMMP